MIRNRDNLHLPDCCPVTNLGVFVLLKFVFNGPLSVASVDVIVIASHSRTRAHTHTPSDTHMQYMHTHTYNVITEYECYYTHMCVCMPHTRTHTSRKCARSPHTCDTHTHTHEREARERAAPRPHRHTHTAASQHTFCRRDEQSSAVCIERPLHQQVCSKFNRARAHLPPPLTSHVAPLQPSVVSTLNATRSVNRRDFWAR